ncbi:MAG: hypothetical protein LBD93_00585 [Treponema sp.]|jgi:hypothetical protein|nr:hypothetical protein [Treponema sp.]
MLLYENEHVPPAGYTFCSINRIGTKRESGLHRALKCRYAGQGGIIEVSAGYNGKYVCDGITKTGEIIEVQIGSFGPLKDKVKHIAPVSPIRIIHPIITQKYIELYDAKNTRCYYRKSPRKGTIWDLFKALVYAPEIPLMPSVTIELVMVAVKQQRRQDGWGSWRRKGITILDTELTAIQDSLMLSGKNNYNVFLPLMEVEPFTSRDLGNTAKITPSLARKTLYVLTRLGIVKRLAKKGNTLLYTRTQTLEPQYNCRFSGKLMY